jgi:hypothetical protein
MIGRSIPHEAADRQTLVTAGWRIKLNRRARQMFERRNAACARADRLCKPEKRKADQSVIETGQHLRCGKERATARPSGRSAWRQQPRHKATVLICGHMPAHYCSRSAPIGGIEGLRTILELEWAAARH